MIGDQVVSGDGSAQVSQPRHLRRPAILVVAAMAGAVAMYAGFAADGSTPPSTQPPVLPVPADPLGASVERVLADPIMAVPFPGDGRVQAITKGEGGWLATVDHAYYAVMWKSIDGLTWTPGFDEDLQGVDIGRMVGLDDGSFLAFGVDRQSATKIILRSDDGLGWEVVDSPRMGGWEVVDAVVAGDRVTIIAGASARHDGGVLPGGEVWSSNDGGRSFERISLEGDPMVLTVVDGETLVMGEIDRRTTWWDLGGRSSPGPAGEGGFSAATPLPGGGLLTRVDHDDGADWFVTTDLVTWQAIADPPAGAHQARLQTVGGLVASVPHPSLVAPVMVSEDGLEWSVLVSGATDLSMVGVAPGPGTSLLTALNRRSMGALLSASPTRFVFPRPEGGRWVEVLGETTRFRRVASADGRVVVADGEQVYEFLDGAFRPLPPSGMTAGAADKVFVTRSTVFLMDGFRLRALSGEGGWQDGYLPVGFLADAIIEIQTGFVTAVAYPERILVSESGEGRVWSDPVVVHEVAGRVWSSPRGLEGFDQDGSTVASTDGLTWVPIVPPVVGGPGSEGRLDIVPADLMVIEVRPIGTDAVVVDGRVDGRPVTRVVTGDGRSVMVPTVLVEGLSGPRLTIHVTASGEIIGEEPGGRVLLWEPEDG